MSGRDLSFDQSVVLDLNRQLRGAARPDLTETAPRREASNRPQVSDLVDAVSRAADTIAQKDALIEHLMDKNHEFESAIDRMKSKLGDIVRLHQATDAKAKAEMERAQRAETRVARLEAQVQTLEGDLDAALSDLHRIADVITGSLPALRQQ